MDLEGAFFDTSQFELTSKKLGQGQFGKVYVVESTNDGSQYAAKIIMNDGEFNGHNQMLLLRETVILYKMKHPAIVKFYGINFHSFDNPDKLEPTIITEYLPHGSLKNMLNNEKKSRADFDWTPTKKYIALLGIADAMRYLHKHGISHRDLKPENVLLDSDYYPRVCDFGLSKCFSKELTKSMKLSMSGHVGTPIYMAPELFKGEDTYGPAIDVYAFAILAYEIVTGKEPYSELSDLPSEYVFMNKIISGYRPKYDDGDMTEKMKTLLSCCWSDNIKERPTFDEIFEQLSTDFTFSQETVDEDEIENYLSILQNEAVDIPINARSSKPSKPTPIDTSALQNEINELKRKCNEYQNLMNKLIISNDDYSLGLASILGNKKEINPQKTSIYLKNSSDHGNCNASYLLGLLYENGTHVPQNFKTATMYYEKSSQQGNSYGYNRIGLCYSKGFGVKKDDSKAFEYFKKAADLGNPTAINNVGALYGKGSGVKQDYNKAIEYYEKAADLGSSLAFFNLGSFYEDGIGVQKSHSKAIEYYRKSVELGNSSAEKSLKNLQKRKK